MNTNNTNKIKVLDLLINNIDYPQLLDIIARHINSRSKCAITYANVHNLNVIQKQHNLYNTLQEFDIIHPDGVGVYLASKFLYGRRGLKKRFVGSDFYEILNQKLVQNHWSTFFLGGEKKTLERIRITNPNLNISGLQDGFLVDNNVLISQLKSLKPDIIFIGMGFPKQELWIIENKDRIDCSVIIAVGEGIKVFSKTKIRGPVFFRRLGFEWFIRLLHNPKRLWKRYIFGNPLFLYRIFKVKMINLFQR